MSISIFSNLAIGLMPFQYVLKSWKSQKNKKQNERQQRKNEIDYKPKMGIKLSSSNELLCKLKILFDTPRLIIFLKKKHSKKIANKC